MREDKKLSYAIKLMCVIVIFAIAYFLGRKSRRLIPLGKGFQVGSFNAVGILIIIFVAIKFFSPSYRSSFYDVIIFGFASFVTNMDT